MFYDYFLIFILSLPILSYAFFGVYLLSTKKPFLYNARELITALVVIIMAVITYFTILKTGNTCLSFIIEAYAVILFVNKWAHISRKYDKYLLYGVDEKIKLVFVNLLKEHKIAYSEKFDIVLTDTNVDIDLRYTKYPNLCSVLVIGKRNNTLVKEILHEVVEVYSKKQSEAYKKTAIIFILGGLIAYGVVVITCLIKL